MADLGSIKLCNVLYCLLTLCKMYDRIHLYHDCAVSLHNRIATEVHSGLKRLQDSQSKRRNFGNAKIYESKTSRLWMYEISLLCPRIDRDYISFHTGNYQIVPIHTNFS